MATARKTAKRNVPAKARRAAKTTLRDARRAAKAVADTVTDLAQTAKRNPRTTALATGIVGVVRARRRRRHSPIPLAGFPAPRVHSAPCTR